MDQPAMVYKNSGHNKRYANKLSLHSGRINSATMDGVNPLIMTPINSKAKEEEKRKPWRDRTSFSGGFVAAIEAGFFFHVLQSRDFTC